MPLRLNGVHHIAVIGTDYERSKRFYLDVLGFTLRSEVYRAERDSWMADLELHGRKCPRAHVRDAGPDPTSRTVTRID